jgi:DNA-binding NarL/FixJ family response regulator
VEATDERLTEAIRVAAVGDGSLPRDLTNRLLDQVGAAGASGFETKDASFTHRELRILRLLAEGLSTLEIARELAYSERTIKQAVHSMTTRLRLRNRSHAVAFAVRKGLI